MARRTRDVLIEKTLPGSFTGTNLDRWLMDHAIVTVTIAGYMTQMCCDTTARQAFQRGYAVKFLSDGTGTLSVTNSAGSISDSDLHRAILVTQQMRFSRVMTTEEWVESLPARPCNPVSDPLSTIRNYPNPKPDKQGQHTIFLIESPCSGLFSLRLVPVPMPRTIS